jgi:putative ABC transport system permease protein
MRSLRQDLRFAVRLLIGVVLASLGICGVMSYAVGQRTHEIGIRMALGAEAGRVQRLVIEQGMRLAAAGVAAGLILSLAATRVISSLLYGVSRFDPTIFVGMCVALAAVALLASYLPARRAARVDPLISLRYE